ncbi:hypothetical protein CASFOL_015433 [Castilleja foliolosa]|uniref:YbaK/aminoacyl-tRNA synthetase-associated domain-containing protein n=1 Tax=Castilleja foliolosa TaxID=1961234 RepID=A0ABD3DHX7_9LAMI
MIDAAIGGAELQIGFSQYEHPVVLTVEAQAKYVGHLKGGLSKNLFLKDKKQRLYIVSALAETKVDLKVLSQRLGLGKGGLRMAPEEALSENFISFEKFRCYYISATLLFAILACAFAEKDYQKATAAATRVLQMGFVLGLGLALFVGLGLQFGSGIFTKDLSIIHMIAIGIPFVAATQPINSLAFVFYGVNFGASDFAYSAYSMHVLPDNFFASPTKLAAEQQSVFLAEADNNITMTNNTSNNPPLVASSSPLTMASLFYSETKRYLQKIMVNKLARVGVAYTSRKSSICL